MSKIIEEKDPGKEELRYMGQFNFSHYSSTLFFVSPLVAEIEVSLTHKETVLA